jgi:hypothetical protein
MIRWLILIQTIPQKTWESILELDLEWYQLVYKEVQSRKKWYDKKIGIGTLNENYLGVN